MGNINLKTVLQYLFFLGLGIALIWWSAKDLTPAQADQLKSSWRDTRFIYLIPVVLAMLASHFSRALRWKQIMKPLGYRPGTTNTFLAVLVGYFFNLLVPRLGEVMKCTILARYEKIAPDKLVGTILAERAVDVISMLLVAIVLLAIQYDRIGAYANEIFQAASDSQAGINPGHIVLFIIILALLFFLMRWLLKKYAHTRLVSRIKSIGLGIWQGLKSLKYIDNWPLFIFHSFFIWFMYLVCIWIGFYAFPPVGNLGFVAAFSVLAFGSVGMIATQGGIGAYQIAVQKTLETFGVAAVTGLAFGWVLWGAQTAIVLLSGVLALTLLPILNAGRTKIKKEPHQNLSDNEQSSPSRS